MVQPQSKQKWVSREGRRERKWKVGHDWAVHQKIWKSGQPRERPSDSRCEAAGTALFSVSCHLPRLCEGVNFRTLPGLGKTDPLRQPFSQCRAVLYTPSRKEDRIPVECQSWPSEKGRWGRVVLPSLNKLRQSSLGCPFCPRLSEHMEAGSVWGSS